MPAPFTIRLDDATLNALDNLAGKTERSRNWLVSRAVEDFVSLNAWQIDKIEAGISQADRREFATDEEVEAVFARLS